MLTVALNLSGSSLRERLSLTQLNTTLMLTGETDSPFGHMHDLILQHLESGFSESVSLASLKIQLEALVSHTSIELQHCSKVGFASKSYYEARGLYICKYYRILVRSHFVKFAELHWLKPKHTEKRQEYIQALILHSLEVQSYCLEGAQVNTLPSVNLKFSFKFLTNDPHTEGTESMETILQYSQLDYGRI